MIRNLLLATDGSVPARRAADFAATLALRFGASLTVLYAHTPNSSGPHTASDQGLKASQARVAELASQLHDMGVGNVTTVVTEGPATHAILHVAETRRPDLLVMGARGASTWQGQCLGSVCMAVLQRAECPVLVVR